MAIDMKTVKAITHDNKSLKNIKDSNGNIIWGSQADYPYRRLEYIKFSGAEYIEENFTLSTKNRRMIIEWDTEALTEGNILLGTYHSASANASRRLFCVRVAQNNTTNVCIGNTWGADTSITANTKYKSTVVYNSGNPNKLSVKIEHNNATLVNTTVTGTTNSIGSTGANGTFGCMVQLNSNNTIYRGSWWVGKLYSFTKYVHTTGTLQNKEYPCQRKSDGVCGLYDVQSGLFFPMTGTTITDAAAGPVVDEYWDLTAPA